ncbi:M20/M25/M40 family metallo-hydrolase [Oceanobacillus halotolerans]|uniref:M20/M25/M40 family metallo-hydrolase n=1 Tax=Oceanobacillus halotolerans TaxID=2663380 RepID=UPI0013DCA16F|nr:M20/M25/M40 family metallo-hydrolase [Oceanobacillus halotolerans]
MTSWQTKEGLIHLVCDLVHHQSITGSNAEIAIAEYLHHLLAQKTYFQEYPDHLSLHPLEDGRRFLTAFVRGQKQVDDTVVLLSHFDVVNVEDYGSLENLAFYPRELTQELAKSIDRLPQSIQNDLQSGDWLFGRGTMDMKAGIALHLAMLEKAMDGEFDGNILMVSVPDEEANSQGMLAALPILQQLKEEESLHYKACLNAEPMFQKYPGDPHHYIYAGSIGKVLPGFYCYGKETHVGDPFSGINPNLMLSFLSQQLELNEAFIEKVDDEVTPPPVSLMHRDLKGEYSVQTPHAAVSMYNVLYLKQSFNQINEKLMHHVQIAAHEIERYVQEKATNFSKVATDFQGLNPTIRVLQYKDLYEEAVKRHGEKEVRRRQNLLVSQREQGDRDFSTLLVQDLASMCKDLAPMIVLFYSPPFYQAVSSYNDPVIKSVLEKVKDFTQDQYAVDLTIAEYFTGLSDLSYIGPVVKKSTLRGLTANMPLQHNGFEFPEFVMEQLTMPVLNIGPLGKDPHQWTERLELTYSFDYLPSILSEAISQLFSKDDL